MSAKNLVCLMPAVKRSLVDARYRSYGDELCFRVRPESDIRTYKKGDPKAA